MPGVIAVRGKSNISATKGDVLLMWRSRVISI